MNVSEPLATTPSESPIPRIRDSETRGSRRPRRRSTGASLIISIVCSELAEARTSSTTLICGMAKRAPRHSTMSAETMASVSGILMTKVVPLPAMESSSIVPPIFSTLVFTTSMPTPRPETLVTVAAVDKPGLKISCRICLSLMVSRSDSLTSPF